MPLSRIDAIKKFFALDGPGTIKGVKLENRELMSMPKEDRTELGDACLKELGEELKES